MSGVQNRKAFELQFLIFLNICISRQSKPRPWLLTKKPLKNTRQEKSYVIHWDWNPRHFTTSSSCFQYQVAFKMHKLTWIFQDMRWVDTKLRDSHCNCKYSQSPCIILGFRLYYCVLADARAVPCSCLMSESCHMLFALHSFVRRNLGLLEHLSYF